MSDSRFKYKHSRVAFAGAAGVDHADYVVPQGTSVKVLQAVGFHDDVAARTTEWRIVRGGVGYVTGVIVGITSSQQAPLYTAIVTPPEPYILRYGDTLRIYAFSLGAGKILSAHAHLEIITGDDTYGD